MPKYYLIILCLFCTACVNTGNFNKVELISVYDGDTFKVNLPCKEELLCKNISIRVKGIDTPEINSKDIYEKEQALKAKQFSKSFLNQKGKILLKNCSRDKYFRLLCEVFIKTNKQEESLAKHLLKEGLASSYDGRNKTAENLGK